MADLKAKLVRGDKYSAEDVLELQLTIDGSAHSCVQHIEIVSGATVTHGGGAPAETPLHYKSVENDANDDGVIDYSSSQMKVLQSEKGITVCKAVATVILKADYDAWKTAHDTWIAEHTEEVDGDRMQKIGSPNAPAYPSATTYKSGNITLEWADDTFV